MRYADDFVILAKSVGGRVERFVEQTLQGRFGLTVNRAKTRTVKLSDPGASLDFLGYTGLSRPAAAQSSTLPVICMAEAPWAHSVV